MGAVDRLACLERVRWGAGTGTGYRRKIITLRCGIVGKRVPSCAREKPVRLLRCVMSPWRRGVQESLLDAYEYGMAGRVFQYDYRAEHRVDIYASFGGLLMLLRGEQLPLKNIEQDQPVYLLIRKTAV